MSRLTNKARTAVVVGVIAGLGVTGIAGGAATKEATRVTLGASQPANAPGQSLALARVTIPGGVTLSEHYHEGTQVARVMSGRLSYTLASGTALLTRAGTTNAIQIAGPKTIVLRRGDTIVENAGLAHFSENKTKRPVIIILTSLLANGAPSATPVGKGAPGTPITIKSVIASTGKTTYSVGPEGEHTYGQNRLVGPSTVDGQAVIVEMLGNVNYTNGSGPTFGFVTFMFADGSTLATTFAGISQATAEGGANFTTTMGVIGGTGKYAAVTGGTGTFIGSRTAAIGANVESTFSLRLINN